MKTMKRKFTSLLLMLALGGLGLAMVVGSFLTTNGGLNVVLVSGGLVVGLAMLFQTMWNHQSYKQHRLEQRHNGY